MDRGAWQATTHEVTKESSLPNQWDGVKETIITDSIKIELKYKKRKRVRHDLATKQPQIHFSEPSPQVFNLAATENVPSIGSSMPLLTTLSVSFYFNVSNLINQMLSCYQKKKKRSFVPTLRSQFMENKQRELKYSPEVARR